MTRRDFVFGTASAAAVSLVGCKTCSGADFDERLSVFISDVHVPAGDSYMLGRFVRTVDEILAMRPLPRRVICFGDLAATYGLKEDYLATLPYFQKLSAIGIELTMAMGNHDRRSAFLEVWPEYAKRTLVRGRIVTRIDLGGCNLLMLDALQGTDDRALDDMGPVAGAMDQDQQEWLADELKRLTHPTIVASHYPVSELKIGETPLAQILAGNPFVKGYVYGHGHCWREGWEPDAWGPCSRSVLRTLGLPSTGLWGDIGHVVARVDADNLEARLIEREFYYPCPKTPVPTSWQRMVHDKQGLRMTFAL